MTDQANQVNNLTNGQDFWANGERYTFLRYDNHLFIAERAYDNEETWFYVDGANTVYNDLTGEEQQLIF